MHTGGPAASALPTTTGLPVTGGSTSNSEVNSEVNGEGDGWTERFATRSFACTARNVPAARRYVSGMLTRGLAGADERLSEADEEWVFRAALCTSELVTNSYDHSASGRPDGTFTVSLFLRHTANDVTAVRVEVIDAGARSVPRPRLEITEGEFANEAESGRGLILVAGVADDCGTYADETSRTTWVELYREGRH
jgi:anti-sigma regulatory factor (Ser/Thr protein kinase)